MQEAWNYKLCNPMMCYVRKLDQETVGVIRSASSRDEIEAGESEKAVNFNTI